MANVIRQDVVQIGFDTDYDELIKLVKAVDDLKKMFKGDFDNDTFNDLAKDAQKLKKNVGGVDDAFKDTKDSTNKFKQALDKVRNAKFDKLKSGINSVNKALGKAVVTAGKLTLAGIGAGATGLSYIVKQSVGAYADREQLIGGVETMFKGDANTIKKYANDAYKNAGLSANEYMETVTGFSASLISSLKGDTKKAATYADMAITDMSDNANKMGTDMSMLQTTYQGFAKQNYTIKSNSLAA